MGLVEMSDSRHGESPCRWHDISPNRHVTWILAAPAIIVSSVVLGLLLQRPPVEPVVYVVCAGVAAVGLGRALLWMRRCKRDHWQAGSDSIRLVRDGEVVLAVKSSQVVSCALSSHSSSILIGLGEAPNLYVRFIVDDLSVHERSFIMWMPSVFQAEKFRRDWISSGMPRLGWD